MQTNFDRFVYSLIAHYNLPTPEKQFDDEIYRFTVNDNMPVKLYGDRNNLVYFVSTLGNYLEEHDRLCSELLKLNNFSLKNPCLTLGLDADNCLIIHTRLSIMDLKDGLKKPALEKYAPATMRVTERLLRKFGAFSEFP